LVFGKASDIIKLKKRPKQKIIDRMANAVVKLHLLIELPEKIINVKNLRDAPESYPDFLSSKKLPH
jgi:hypothetical protein